MYPIRRTAAVALACALALLPAAVAAHTELAESSPADGDTVTESPTEVVLVFATEVAESASFTVTDPNGDAVGDGELDLDVADRNILRGSVDVVAPGRYVVAYVVVGDDGHEVTGDVSFTFAPPGDSGTPSPDTALPADADSARAAAVLAGLGMLAAAVAIRRRRSSVRG